MRLPLCAGVAVLTLGACGSDAPPRDGAQYATGQLPTADSVLRESDVHQSDVHQSDVQLASGESRDEDRERERDETSEREASSDDTAN